jgi:hypothetical protein
VKKKKSAGRPRSASPKVRLNVRIHPEVLEELVREAESFGYEDLSYYVRSILNSRPAVKVDFGKKSGGPA